MAETFKSHPWVQSGSVAPENVESPAVLLAKSVKDNEDKTIKGKLMFKMRDKINGRRQWHKRWGVVRHHVLFLYLTEDEDRVDDQHLSQAIDLKHKNIFIYTMGKHDFMLGLQDTVKQQTVVWLRFDSEFDYSRWKEFLTARYEKEVSDMDPQSDANQMKKILAPKNSNFASSLASNLANNIVAAQYRENLHPEALGTSELILLLCMYV
jgi:predicted transposase YbfD/YdcC